MTSEKDIEDAQRLGYHFDVPVNVATDQINRFFPGIELVILLERLENLLSAHTEVPTDKKIIINTIPSAYFQILYLSANYWNEDTGLTMSRYFEYEQDRLIVYHHYFVLPKSARGQGIGTKVQGAWLEQYMNMEVKEIHVHAGLKDGGLVWAKMGFKALYKHEMENILRSAEQLLSGTDELEAVKAIFDAYYEKDINGKSFPIRNWANIEAMKPILKLDTNNWHGWIDLTNPQELLNFKKYVGRE